ncbi:MAG: 30S ribosomal protein S6 [Oscillospiraceae bacterium]|jgi:small subunit ribosomal protein S6|nr:30S ribosomal protein S6 [Oscillospiraceae bacterium]
MYESTNYELYLIFSISLGEEKTEEFLKKVVNIINMAGAVGDINKWGKKRLAYEIKKEAEGFYILINFESERKIPLEIERVAGITDGVLRSLIVKK